MSVKVDSKTPLMYLMTQHRCRRKNWSREDSSLDSWERFRFGAVRLKERVGWVWPGIKKDGEEEEREDAGGTGKQTETETETETNTERDRDKQERYR